MTVSHSCRMVHRAAIVVSAVLAPCLAGCGVNAYEQKFAGEVERIKLFDLADQALGNPIDYPNNIGTKQQPMITKQELIFLRLPNGFATKAENENNPLQGFLYRFVKELKPAAPPIRGEIFPPPNEKDIGIREIYVAFTMDTTTRDQFRGKLEQIFRGAKPQPRRTEKRVGREPIVYDAWTWTDGYKPATSLYQIYAAQGDSNSLVAVVFRIPEDKANAASIKSAIQFTLQSLVIGNSAATLNQNFRPRKESGKKTA